MSLTNHPNRGKTSSPCRSPSSDEVKALRHELGLTQVDAANLVCYSKRAWQHCETGDRRMHPAAWQLFCLKTMNLPRPDPRDVAPDEPDAPDAAQPDAPAP